MPRYRVRFYEKVGYEVQIDAESPDDIYDNKMHELVEIRHPNNDAFDAQPLQEEDITLIEPVTST